MNNQEQPGSGFSNCYVSNFVGVLIATFAAMERGDAKTVNQLLAQLPEDMIDDTDYKGRTLLHLAVEHGLDDVVETLMALDIDLGAKAGDCGDYTALHFAAEFGRDKITTRLLDELPNLVHQRTQNKRTALHLAVVKGHATIVRQLLATDLELVDNEEFVSGGVLEFAVNYGREEIITMLLESVRSKSLSFGQVLFSCAVRMGYDHIATQLLAQNPRLIDKADANGNNALHLAAARGRGVIAAQLIAEKPYLIKARSDSGKPVLHLAIEADCEQIVAQLLAVEPNLIHKLSPGNKNALHVAAECGCGKLMAQLLAAKPAMASHMDSHGQLPLHHAAAGLMEEEDALAQLVAANPEAINLGDKKDLTPLQLAVRSCRTENVAYLLAHGAIGVNEEMFWSVLAMKDFKDVSGMVKVLLTHKPDLIDSMGPCNNTVLHAAAGFRIAFRKFSEDLMRTAWQLKPQAARALNSRKETPLHIAIQLGNEFAIELVQWQFSVEEIMGAFAENRRQCPQSLLNNLRTSLLQLHWCELLNQDSVDTVYEYFGLGPDKRKGNKRMRNHISDDDEEIV